MIRIIGVFVILCIILSGCVAAEDKPDTVKSELIEVVDEAIQKKGPTGEENDSIVLGNSDGVFHSWG